MTTSIRAKTVSRRPTPWTRKSASRRWARRNKLLGLWAAEKLGLGEEAAQAYAKEVVVADLEEHGDEDVFRKLRTDFDAKGVEVSDHQNRRNMDEFLAQAVQAVRSGE